MNRVAALVIAFWIGCVVYAQPAYTPPDPFNDALRVSYGIWKNLGQIVGPGQTPQPDIQYYTEGAEPRAYFQKDAKLSLVLASEDTSTSTPDTASRLDISFTGELAQTPDAYAYELKDYRQNFYLPWCGPFGVTNVHGYNRVVYENIYPFIDMHVYSGRAGQKIAFVVRPGGVPENLQLLLQGQNQLSLDFFGNLKIVLADKWIVLRQALAYQVDGNGNVQMLNWTADYVPNNNTGVVGFTFAAYDDSKPLVLLIGASPVTSPPNTPGVCYATYFGGGGEDRIRGSATDSEGNYYTTGFTYSSFLQFPGNAGTEIFTGGVSMFATCQNGQDHIVWKNFFGASSGYASCIAVRDGTAPQVYVGGYEYSHDYWVTPDGPEFNQFNCGGAGVCGTLIRFNGTTGAAEWSTYFGSHLVVYNLTIDPLDRLTVVGESDYSLPTPDVTPPPPGAEQWNSGGGSDGFISLFTPGDNLLWTTHFGGSGYERATTVRGSGNKVVVVGCSASPAFPQSLNGGGDQNQSTQLGIQDMFLLEFDLNYDLQWGTLFGGNGLDEPGLHGLDIDPHTGDIYVVGRTESTDLPITHAGDWYDDTPTGAGDGVIFEFSNSRSRKWVTYVSGNGGTLLNAVRVQNDRQVFIGGETADVAFPCAPQPQLYSEDQIRGGQDGLVMCFTKDHWYAWGTYFGGDDPGTQLESVFSIALKDGQRLYVSGTTDSPYDDIHFFPLTDEGIPSWFDETLAPEMDGFVAAFCIANILTGIPNLPAQEGDALTVWQGGNGVWTIQGAEPGVRTLALLDAGGRLVSYQSVRVRANALLQVPIPWLAQGIYVLRIGDRMAYVAVIQP